MGAPPSAIRVGLEVCFGGQGGIGAPPSARRRGFNGGFGHGGMGAPPSATQLKCPFQFIGEMLVAHNVADKPTTPTHTATTKTLLFAFIDFPP